ncbi:MAG: SDR family NAD(P)-dependent oxidoreductase [Cytophagales bacterium]|nr:SDR family NAD(P)-dependent oxidoreductase [Cytophagales bacterium]
MSKLAAITGGTKGIGRALVEKFAAAGFDIVTCARQAVDLTSLKKEVEAKHAVKVHVKAADLSDRHQVSAFTDFVGGLNQPLDVLINNAGYFAPGAITDEPEGALEQMVAANLYSAYHITRALVGPMKERKQGHVFNMCSVASIKAYPNGGSYAISKFALLGFSKTLREELMSSGIRVTAILPGATRTTSWDATDLPEERFMKPEDVADAVFGAFGLSSRSVVEEIIIRPQAGDI